jgi:phage-related protein
MSEDLFYNRDRNISGVVAPENLSSLNLKPVYGSKVEFSANNYSYETSDSYYNIIPMSLNSLKASYKLRYDVNEINARKLTNFFESKLGYQDISFAPDSNIYRDMSGYVDNYAINHVNSNHYEFAVDITADQAPNLLNWVNMNFLNFNFKSYELGVNYKKYDVVYYNINDVKINNFYYCTEDHFSSSSNMPNKTASKWTQDFFYEPDIGFQNDVKFDVEKLEFKNSFPIRIKGKKNIALVNISYKFTDITDHQLKSMLHFLENKAGYRRFKHQIPSVYNRPKVYICPEWRHTWNYYNCNDLEVTFIEDPLGVIPNNL